MWVLYFLKKKRQHDLKHSHYLVNYSALFRRNSFKPWEFGFGSRNRKTDSNVRFDSKLSSCLTLSCTFHQRLSPQHPHISIRNMSTLKCHDPNPQWYPTTVTRTKTRMQQIVISNKQEIHILITSIARVLRKSLCGKPITSINRLLHEMIQFTPTTSLHVQFIFDLAGLLDLRCRFY